MREEKGKKTQEDTADNFIHINAVISLSFQIELLSQGHNLILSDFVFHPVYSTPPPSRLPMHFPVI